MKNFFAFILIALLTLAGLGQVSAQAPRAEYAGDVIANLRNIDLYNTNVSVNIWTNRTAGPFSVGNFRNRTAANLFNLVNLGFGATNINAVWVNGTSGNVIRSLSNVPSVIGGRGTVTLEAWIYATDTSGVSCVGGYGNAANRQNREFNYSTGGQGAVSAFGDDATWTPAGFPTINTWHHVVYQYDGTNFLAYQDGVLNTLVSKPNWNTAVGSTLAFGAGNNNSAGDPFKGYIAAGRVMTGVLTPNQVLSNYNAGLFADYDILASTPVATPNVNIFQDVGITVNITENAYTNNQAVGYQWYCDGGTAGLTFTNIPGATATNYVLDTTTVPTGPYQFQVVVTGDISVTSAPVKFTVSPSTQPLMTTSITPTNTLIFAGQGVKYTTAWIGNQPITYQWQESTDGGVTYSNLPGHTNAIAIITNRAVSDSGLYRVIASNAVGSSNSPTATLTVRPTSALPQVQVAGTVLVNLQSTALDPGSYIWANHVQSPLGDFWARVIDATNSFVNVDSNTVTWNLQPINTLMVLGSGNRALQTLVQTPDSINGRGACSVEAWAYVTSFGGVGVVGWGQQGQAAFPLQHREFAYGNSGGNSAFTGNFGNADTSWSTIPPAGVLHYLVWTYDGTNQVRCYADGVFSRQNNGTTTLVTPANFMEVGCGTPTYGDVFNGYVATVRVSTGILTPIQIATNFIAGPIQPLEIAIDPVLVSPGTNLFQGDTLTLTETNVQSINGTFTYQWQTDNGSSGAAFANIVNATDLTFVTNTAPQAVAKYIYQLVVTDTTSSIVATSPPVIINLNAGIPPAVVQNPTPTNATVYVGQQISFTATFTGNQPYAFQWFKSIDGGANYSPMSSVTNNTATNSTLTMLNLGLGDTALYRIQASNIYGPGAPSAGASLTVLPLSARASVTAAGDVIAIVQSGDLDPNAPTWINQSISPNSVGIFSGVSTVNPTLNITTNTYNFNPIKVLTVGGTVGNSVYSANNIPDVMTGNGPSTVEAWVFPTGSNPNSAAVAYGLQGNDNPYNPRRQREFNYNTGGNGATSGFFGGYDTGWTGTLTLNTWHYLAWTYDGTTLSCYMDGVLNTTKVPTDFGTNAPLNTASSLLSFGAAVTGRDNAGPYPTGDTFQGSIASARVMTGVMTASQIANNFRAGPDVTVGTPGKAPMNTSLANGGLTITWTASVSFLEEATSAAGPWTATPGATSPYTVVIPQGAADKFYRLHYTQ